MKLIQYVYFEKPGEKQALEDIAKISINKIDMAGRVMNTFEIELNDAIVIADKFFKK